MKLMDNCHRCGYGETIQEDRNFDGSTLAVAVCPLCRTYDWELPSDYDDEDVDLLDRTGKWAREESIKILRERDLYYTIRFSEPARILLSEYGIIDGLKGHIIDLCKFLGTDTVYVTQCQKGIKIEISEISVHLTEESKDE